MQYFFKYFFLKILIILVLGLHDTNLWSFLSIWGMGFKGTEDVIKSNYPFIELHVWFTILKPLSKSIFYYLKVDYSLLKVLPREKSCKNSTLFHRYSNKGLEGTIVNPTCFFVTGYTGWVNILLKLRQNWPYNVLNNK